MHKVDLTKPVRTRDGREVFTMPHGDSILGFIINQSEEPMAAAWYKNGKLKTIWNEESDKTEHPLDLVNVNDNVENIKPYEYYINIHTDEEGETAAAKIYESEKSCRDANRGKITLSRLKLWKDASGWKVRPVVGD